MSYKYERLLGLLRLCMEPKSRFILGCNSTDISKIEVRRLKGETTEIRCILQAASLKADDVLTFYPLLFTSDNLEKWQCTVKDLNDVFMAPENTEETRIFVPSLHYENEATREDMQLQIHIIPSCNYDTRQIGSMHRLLENYKV